MMISHITLVVILFFSNTLAKPRPQEDSDPTRTVEGSSEGSGEHSEESEEGSGFFKYVAKPRPQEEPIVNEDYNEPDAFFTRTVEGSSEGSGEYSEEPEEGSGFFKYVAKPRPQEETIKKEEYKETIVNEEYNDPDAFFTRTVEGSSEGSGEYSEEQEEGSGFFKNIVTEVERERDLEPEARLEPSRNIEESEEDSDEFIEGEMGSGMVNEVVVKLAEEEEMTTESEMLVNNLVPRFDLEIGSGDTEELLKISSEEETSGDGIIFKIMTEEVGEGSGAEFRFAEVSDEIGSGDDSTEASFELAVRVVEGVPRL